MKGFNELNEFKKLKFQSVIPQDILQAVDLLEKLGYEAGGDFSADDAACHNGICAWDDGEITEGWLDTYSDFEQVTLDGLKEMVGETNRCDNTLSNNFTVAWEQVFGEKFIDSVYKAVKKNKVKTLKNEIFTLERLLGCEVKLFCERFYLNENNLRNIVSICKQLERDLESGLGCLTFFTEDGDELTFDEYVQLYYPKG